MQVTFAQWNKLPKIGHQETAHDLNMKQILVIHKYLNIFKNISFIVRSCADFEKIKKNLIIFSTFCYKIFHIFLLSQIFLGKNFKKFFFHI